MAWIYKPPKEISPELFDQYPSIFLAGSIEMGTAEDWQVEVEDALIDYNIMILNPRRDDWDSSWEQSIDNPQFKEQVEWELHGLEECTIPFFYFAPGTKSPISLLELGLMAQHENAIVCCPEGFWRKGNVDIVCDMYSITLFDNLDMSIDFLKTIIEEYSV